MPEGSNRRLGADINAQELKSTPGSPNPRLGVQIDAWELKSMHGSRLTESRAGMMPDVQIHMFSRVFMSCWVFKSALVWSLKVLWFGV